MRASWYLCFTALFSKLGEGSSKQASRYHKYLMLNWSRRCGCCGCVSVCGALMHVLWLLLLLLLWDVVRPPRARPVAPESDGVPGGASGGAPSGAPGGVLQLQPRGGRGWCTTRGGRRFTSVPGGGERRGIVAPIGRECGTEVQVSHGHECCTGGQIGGSTWEGITFKTHLQLVIGRSLGR